MTSSTTPLATRTQQRRRLSLLALLALAGEHGLSRERIQSYLWPENAADRARHALDQLLYATRRDLGPDVIVSTTSDVRLNRSVLLPDIWRFDDAVRSERWAEAVDLYVGPVLDGVHLIDGVEFERLLDAERSGREQDYFGALEALAAGASSRGDRAEALRWWRRRAAAEPLSLPVALQVMRGLDAIGDSAGAIQHARLYQRVVRETLEVEADATVQALAEEIALRPSKTSGVIVARRPEQTSTVPLISPLGRRWRWRHAAAAGLLLVTVGPFIRPALLARSRVRPASPVSQTKDPRARELYLRGRTSWDKRTKEGLEDAVVQFRLAAEHDPAYAAAYTGLADSYAMLGYFGFAPADAMFPKARGAAMRALELDPSAGEAYAALGQALAWEHAWADAEQAYRRALELSPNDATVHQWYALLLAYLGRAHEAAVHSGQASRLDPLSVQINNMYGMMLYHDGDLRGALRQFDRTVVAEPDSAWVRQNPWVLANFARVAQAGGRHEQALYLARRALEVVPAHPRALFELASIYVVSGDTSQGRAVFARADTAHPHYAFYRAWLHALLGEMNQAYEWLDRIDEWALPPLIALGSDPSLATLRADPRYAGIRRRLGMPAH